MSNAKKGGAKKVAAALSEGSGDASAPLSEKERRALARRLEQELKADKAEKSGKKKGKSADDETPPAEEEGADENLGLGDEPSGDETGTDTDGDEPASDDEDSESEAAQEQAADPEPSPNIIPMQPLEDDADPRHVDVLMLFSDKCLKCKYLIGDALGAKVSGKHYDGCHYEFGVNGAGEKTGNPNCPAKTVQIVKALAFNKAAAALAEARTERNPKKLAEIAEKLSDYHPLVVQRVFELAEKL